MSNPNYIMRRQLPILMMFNRYDLEDGEETEQSQQRQCKRTRREVPDTNKLMIALAHAKCYVGKPTYKLDLTAKQQYQQKACSNGCRIKSQTYCACNWYKWICKHCHVKHVLTVHNRDNSDSSSQKSGHKDENARKRKKTEHKNWITEPAANLWQSYNIAYNHI